MNVQRLKPTDECLRTAQTLHEQMLPMIAPLFGTKSALDHPADRPAILRIFLSDRYPLFPQHHRVFDSFSHFAGPEPGLLVASPPGLRREIPPAPRMHGSGKRCRFSVLNILRLSETTQTSRRFPRNSASSLIDPATGRDVPNDPAEHRSVPFLRLPAAGRKLRVRTPVPNGLRRTFFPRREREI